MSQNQDPYDPTAPEDAPGRGQYVSKKDIKVLGIGVIAFALILSPFYFYGVRQSEKVRCTANVKAIYDAMDMYATEHDDRLPPVYQTQADGVTPYLSQAGRPWTYVSEIHRYFTPRASFECPSAKEGESVVSEHPQSSRMSISSTYGMYFPYGGFLRSVIASPGTTLIFAETSNHGSQDSYNPMPFEGVPYDGFVIGWNDANDHPTANTQSVTRLAFRNSASGNFRDARGRHDNGIHAVTANGSLMVLKPTDARVRVQKSTGLPVGIWESPP